jgi:hypothetical protein
MLKYRTRRLAWSELFFLDWHMALQAVSRPHAARSYIQERGVYSYPSFSSHMD